MPSEALPQSWYVHKEQFPNECCKTKTRQVTDQLDDYANLTPKLNQNQSYCQISFDTQLKTTLCKYMSASKACHILLNDHQRCTLWHTYRGYWPSLFNQDAWIFGQGLFLWVRKIYYIVFWEILCRTQQLVARKKDGAIIPTQVANHSTGFATSCNLTELAIE